MRNLIKRKITFLIYSALLISFCSCQKNNIFFSDRLSLERQDYNDNQLRIDGYYYCLSQNNGIVYSIFFYRNGVVINGGGNSTFEELEKIFTLESFKNSKYRYDWGIFIINSNKILIESWHPGSGGLGSPAFVRSGEIINDTTFVMTEVWRSHHKKRTLKSINEVYHFRQFSPKPDSTNNFIE